MRFGDLLHATVKLISPFISMLTDASNIMNLESNFAEKELKELTVT